MPHGPHHRDEPTDRKVRREAYEIAWETKRRRRAEDRKHRAAKEAAARATAASDVAVAPAPLVEVATAPVAMTAEEATAAVDAIVAARAAAAAVIPARPASTTRIRSPLRALEIAAVVTQDQRFIEAIVALKFYGLDKEFMQNIPHADVKANSHLFQVDHLYLYGDGERRYSVVEACEFVVAEHGIGSTTTTFEVEVERLRQFWKRTRTAS
jgi:hypothetical protein